MATIFVSAVDGTNADNGSTWALAKQTVAGALAIAASGDIILVDNAGTFTAGAAITWTPPAGNVAIISVNRSGGNAWAAGAIENVGGSASAFLVNGAAGSAMFVYGMTLRGGASASASCVITILGTNSVNSYFEAKACTLDLAASTSNLPQIHLGQGSNGSSRALSIKLNDCTFLCSGSRFGNFISINSTVEIVNPTISLTGANKPAGLFSTNLVNNHDRMLIRDGTIAGYNVSGGAYFDLTNMAGIEVTLVNLITSSTPALTTGSWPAGGTGSITQRNVDSANTDYVFSYQNARGTLTVDTGVYMDGGASFNSQNVSWKIVTTSAASEFTPFVTPPLAIWDTSTSAQTATWDIVRDSATNLTDRDIWPAIDYAASGTTTQYTAGSGRNANPFTGTGTNWAASSETWTGTGSFTNPNKQTMSIALTAARDGLLQGRVYVGLASATIYLNPQIAGIS
jgi:hypothetical protein